MKLTRGSILLTVAALLATPCALNAQPYEVGTGFTYQGRLMDGGIPADGDYDFEFALYDDPGGTSPAAGPISFDDWPVSNGLFTIELDFGSDVFTGDARWLEMGVRP
ncbi:MAG: hypothetical protein ACYSUI_17440, partial [Planctomycetota bacterium]